MDVSTWKGLKVETFIPAPHAAEIRNTATTMRIPRQGGKTHQGIVGMDIANEVSSDGPWQDRCASVEFLPESRWKFCLATVHRLTPH